MYRSEPPISKIQKYSIRLQSIHKHKPKMLIIIYLDTEDRILIHHSLDFLVFLIFSICDSNVHIPIEFRDKELFL